MDATVTAQAEKYFSELSAGQTVEDRLSDVQGSRRWQRVIQIYSVKKQDERITLPFYNVNPEADGAEVIIEQDGKKMVNIKQVQPALKRSKFNSRRQDSVVRKYAKQILDEGIQLWCRGSPIATDSEILGNYNLIAAASMTEALYTAAEAQPDNIYVVAAVESGLVGTLVLTHRIAFS